MRPSERDRRLLSGFVLLAVMAGHALRETARDTLFLSSLPAARLPWAYLAIAALALAVGTLMRALLARFSQRRLLAGTLALGALGDLAFWLSREEAPLWSFAFYVWTGLISSTATMQFWLHLADAFAVDEAKRSFAPIAAGGLVGAVAGSAAASLMLLAWPAHSLLLASSLLFGGAAFLPWLLPSRLEAPLDPGASAPAAAPMTARALLENPYLSRLLALAACGAVLATGIDFLFKSSAAAAIPRDRLGLFFARFQAGVNLSALVFQLALAPLLLRSFGVIRALAVLPGLLLAGSAALIAAPGLLSASLLRAADGTLRHSLHRAGAEVLYLPLEASQRATFRTLAESIGHRGGQALASLAILLVLTLRTGQRSLGAALLAISALSLLSLIGLRQQYVARFREQLRGLRGDPRDEVPRLDLHSLEVLVACLSSPNDSEVLSALDVLEAYDKTALVPPLILHHPSRPVVLRALEQFARSSHPHVDALLERLLSHEDAEVRAAALRAYAAREVADARILDLLRKDPSARVRATAMVVWLARRGDASRLQRLTAEILDGEDRVARLALARALPALPHPEIAAPVRRLLADPDDAVVAELAQSATADARPAQVPLLVELLARRGARSSARAALASLGERALDALADALRSAHTTEPVRRQLPGAIARFHHPRAVALLVEALEADDPRIRSEAARGLGRLREVAPLVPIPAEPLERAAARSLERAVTMLCHEATYAAWSELRSPASAQGEDLLRRLLQEEQGRSLERVFRLLHVLEPGHGYAEIFHALRRGGIRGAGSREMVEHLVEGRLRDGILAVAESASPLERLRRATSFFAPPGAAQLLGLLADGPPAQLADGGRAALEELAREALASVERDVDPILGQVARERGERAIRR